MEEPALGPKTPEHEIAYRRLREMVLLGQLAPGQGVTIHGIARALGAGQTPVREAIRRLTAEGALVLQENRRVTVPRLDLAQVDELALARQALEPELARRAAMREGQADLADRLAALDAQVDRAIATQDVAGYLAANARFHFTLYEAAGAPILLSLTGALWLRVGPSLRVVMETGGPSGPDRHRETVAALRAQRPDAVARAIGEDIEQGLSRLRAALAGA